MQKLNFKAIAVSIALLFLSPASVAHEVSLADAKKALYIPELQLYSRQLEITNGIHLHVGSVQSVSQPGGGRYTCQPLSSTYIEQAHRRLQSSLKKTKVTASMGLEHLILCGGLTANGRHIGGIPVPPLKLLMLSVSAQSGDSVTHLFWHELIHYLEIKTGTYQDRTWNSHFSNYRQHYNLQAKNVNHLGSGETGFINAYGQSFAHEERAEIVAWLLTSPKQLATFLRQANDTILDQKVNYMRNKIRDLGVE